MGSTVFDSLLFRDMFGTAEMRAIFSDEALIGRYLQVEAALARAEARCGVIPADAAEAIERACSSMAVDHERLRLETEIVGYPILPLVHQLAEAAGEAGRYVHWGATTQDIMDSASVLQIKDALDTVSRDLRDIATVLERLAFEHRDTAMPGRTHLQQALPITFGYKAAVWLSSIRRHIERVDQARPRILLGQLSGAAGTLASLSDDGLAIQAAFCDILGLDQPPISWHVARDGLAEAVALLGLVTGTLGKIATDVAFMAATELGELSEPFVAGRGSSSTMPQKQNPISSELMLAAAKSVRQHVAAMLDGMIQDFERATGPWHVEWISIPESFLLTAASLSHAKFMLSGLVVNKERMIANLGMTNGLIVAEAVMMAAAPAIGRQRAHDIVYEACRRSIDLDRPLSDVLVGSSEISAALGGQEAIKFHCDPANYIGLSGKMVDRVLSVPL